MGAYWAGFAGAGYLRQQGVTPAGELQSTKLSDDADLEPGALLRGKYRIVRVLGKGGMGVVYEATHIDLEQRVAIKLLHPELRSQGELVERFLREGRAASKIVEPSRPMRTKPATPPAYRTPSGVD